jgi:hypothetical protein
MIPAPKGRDPLAEHYRLSRGDQLDQHPPRNPPPSKQHDHATKISFAPGGGLGDGVKVYPYHGG